MPLFQPAMLHGVCAQQHVTSPLGYESVIAPLQERSLPHSRSAMQLLTSHSLVRNCGPRSKVNVSLFLYHHIMWTHKVYFVGIVSGRNSADREVTSFVQISRTLSFTYSPSLPKGSRLRALYISGKPVSLDQIYVISTIDFVAGGGDGFIYPPKTSSPPLNSLDVVLAEYVTATSPFTPFLDGRIKSVRAQSEAGKQVVVNPKQCYGAECALGQ